MSSQHVPIVDKPWGHEKWLVNNEKENYCGKILYIKEGHSSSMHYHVKKHETFYILSGTLQVDMINTLIGEVVTYTIKQGETFEVERNDPHQLIAVNGPVEFIEISSFHEDSDSLRIWK